MIDLFRHMFDSTTGIYVNQFVKFLNYKTRGKQSHPLTENRK